MFSVGEKKMELDVDVRTGAQASPCVTIWFTKVVPITLIFYTSSQLGYLNRRTCVEYNV